MFILSIVWLLLTQLFSLFLCFVIYQFISAKPILAVTLVDLVYHDTIVYNHLICFVSSAAMIHCLCLNNETLTLSYKFAMAYSTSVNFFISCFSISLIISGGLKLISAIKKSEAAGLQLLGPDYIALNKIRLISVVCSIIFPCLMISFYNAHTRFFTLLHGNLSTSFVNENNKSLVPLLYLALPCIAALVNIIAKICSNYIINNIEQQVNVFIIFGSKQCKSKDNLSFSLEAAIGIPLVILFAFLSSFSDRINHLTFYVPFQIMFMGFIIPLFIIKRNIKIMNFMKQNYINIVLEHHFISSLMKWNSAVVPFQEMNGS
jgi:hypothetical protein